MKINVIVTGATGMVGKGVLLECLDHINIAKVLHIGRNPLGLDHPKLQELVVKDFSDFNPHQEKLRNYDACYHNMGISAAGLSEEAYHTITHDYTMALAGVLYENNPKMTFIYVSGEGTDSTEKGSMMWARVKGKTENKLLQKGFKQAFMFRPGAIIPMRGIKSKTKLYQFMYDYFLWLVKAYKAVAPNSVVNTTQVGLAMIHATLKGYKQTIVKPKDIITLAKVKAEHK